MKWVIYEIPKWRRVGGYPDRVKALDMVHSLHRNVRARRYTVKQEVV